MKIKIQIKIPAAFTLVLIFFTACAITPPSAKNEAAKIPLKKPVASAPVETSFYLYMIALEDNGGSGPKVGCGDSLVRVESQAKNAKESLEILLASKTQWYGQSGLYNSLYQSELNLKRFEEKADVIEVDLEGKLQLGGVCDNPRLIEQITAAARQSTEKKIPVIVLVNGTPLEELLSGK